MILHQYTEKIWTIENFLTPSECDELIQLSNQLGYEEAKVSTSSGAKMIKGLRNNDRLFHEDNVLAQKLWSALQSFCPTEIEGQIAVGLNERFRFYRYDISQRFKRHIDGRYTRNEQEQSRITFLVYLNDDYQGGETAFDDVTITPKTGTALCFIHEIKHEGKPLLEGTKYVLRSDVMYKTKSI